jgi:trigger factor
MEATSTIQDVDAVTKKIFITVPADAVSSQLDSALARVSKTARIKGFRDGKAPKHLIQKMYGERIKAEVHQELVTQGLRDAAKQHDINIVGSPQVSVASVEVGKPFEFNADVSIYPKPEISVSDSIDITVPKREVTDEEVTQVVEYLRKSRATMKPIEGRTALQKGDVGQAEFVVIEEGGTPSRPEPYSFCLGEGQLPKEVEDAFEGMAIGETREASVTPEGGKKITYRGTLKSLMERILPELDDAFAKLVDPAASTVLELRLKIRESLDQEKQREHTSDVTAAVIEHIVAANDFPVPQVLIDDEIRGLLVSRGFVDPRKMNIEALPMDVFRKELGEAAIKRVRAAIIIDRFVEKEGIKLAKEDMEKGLQDRARSMNISLQEAQQQIFQQERGMQFMVETLRNKGLEALRSKAKITFGALEKSQA